MLYTCKKATELLEKSRLVGLSPMEQISLRFHFAVCKPCRVYKQQSAIIEKSLDKLFSQKLSDQTAETLSPQAKERILKALDRQTETDL